MPPAASIRRHRSVRARAVQRGTISIAGASTFATSTTVAIRCNDYSGQQAITYGGYELNATKIGTLHQ